METEGGVCLRILCRNLKTALKEPGIQWLIGLPSMPLTIVSTLRCLHTLEDDPFSPNFQAESDDLMLLLPRGFNVIGAIYVKDQNWEINAHKAALASTEMKRKLHRVDAVHTMIGAASDLISKEIHYFTSNIDKPMRSVIHVTYEEKPEKSLWDIGSLVRAAVEMKLPVYVPSTKPKDTQHILFALADEIIAKLKSPSVVYMVKGSSDLCDGCTSILRYSDLNFSKDGSREHLENYGGVEPERNLCSYFCSKGEHGSASPEMVTPIQVIVLLNRSKYTGHPTAPSIDVFPVDEPVKQQLMNVNLDILCYAPKVLSIASAVSELVIPGLIDQLTGLKKKHISDITLQLHPYHFLPPGFLHPVTAIYELSYGETERKQVEIRRELHMRLGLPLDRPLLRVVNALKFGMGRDLLQYSNRLKNVHNGVLNTGVVGSSISLVDGSYEYYHYLQDSINDSGWGCAYRSLQTIISWFKLQHYTSIDVPSHRDIQQALVEIGDKDLSFVGSSEWIGAIELSFVLDKLLGVSCKIINVRSGAELPEKCRELALHFETQGTPVMIGGGVLAYTLLGVDYNDQTGDCAFLILDPHYTGKDELKSILNGGWCGWKKAVDSKGKHFFLHDKFYNLLLPQRPNMV